jgi:hypothetical protein
LVWPNWLNVTHGSFIIVRTWHPCKTMPWWGLRKNQCLNASVYGYNHSDSQKRGVILMISSKIFLANFFIITFLLNQG